MGEFNLRLVNNKLDEIQSEILAIEGITSQYSKSGTSIAEMGQACSWALELNTDFAPPTTTEIEPGNYQIDQIRGAVTTNIVASTPASESAGTIYANYTPTETNWNIGDLAKITFSSGYTRTDQTPTAVLTSNAAIGENHVHVADATLWLVGQLCRVYDDVGGSEWLTIDSISDALTLTFTTNLAINHTTANNAGVTRAVRHDLTTAIFFTMIQASAQNFKILGRGTFTSSSMTAPADSARTEGDNYWNGCWLMAIEGAAVNQPRLIVDYTGTGGIFTLDPEQTFSSVSGASEYLIIGNDSQLAPAADGTNNYTPAHVIGNKESVAVFAASTTADVIAYLKGILASMTIADGTFTTSSATVPADTGRTEGNDFFNGTLLIPVAGVDAFQPRLIVDYTGTGGIFTLDPSHPFTADTGLVDYIVVAAQGDLVPTADSTNNTTVMDVVGNKADAATLDDMTALATASLVAEVKRLLLRMSSDAFTATIQGSARTELDTMLGQLATYLSAAGAAWSVQVNSNTARTNLEQVLEDYFGVIGCDNTNVFNPTIQGSARTTVDAALEILASYFTASSAAYSAQVNNQTLRTNLEAILQDYFAVVGCDGANTFSVTAQGVAQTVLDTALYSLAQYFATDGAAISATVNPGGSARATLELILEDLGDMLAGSAGIVTWPGSVKYGNGISMAEAVAYVSDTADTISSSVSEGNLEITEDAGGSATVITASEITQAAGFWKGGLLLSTSGANDGQERPIVASAVGSVTVFPAFDNNVALNDTLILISTWRPDVWNQQDDVAVTFNVTNATADALDLSVAGFSYDLNSLRLKFADPGAQTITVTLNELINDVATAVDTFTVDTTNYATYHSLMDMFGVPHITGNDIRIAAVATDAGPYACTGQYQYALARTS